MKRDSARLNTPTGSSQGADVDEAELGIVEVPRMYQLIRQRTPIKDTQFEIEFLDLGAIVLVFTFG